ncbi:MAG: ABC transporter substrate-binding protein [Thermodesulfobacteriota bacterium]|nr:ABC transporter substrate-binding protein [Thermodesulfobacteriota bacterium]
MMRKRFLTIRRHLLFLFILTSILLLLIISTGYSKEVRGVTEDTIKIGIMVTLTGPAADEARWLYEAEKNFYRNINDTGGIHGRKIKWIVEDDRYQVPSAIAAFKKLVFKDKVLYLQGPTGSSLVVALMTKAEKNKIPMISVTVGEKIIKPFKRYNFTLTSLYQDHSAVVFDYLMKDLKLKNPRIGFVYPDNEYGKRALYAARDNAKRYGMKLVDEEVLNVVDIDATTVILGLKRAKVDWVISQGYNLTTSLFFKDSKKFGFFPNYVGLYAACNEDAIKMLRGTKIHYYANHCYSSWYENVPGIVRMREITLGYHPKADKLYRNKRLYSVGWFLSCIFAEGLKRAGRNLNGETLVDAFETFREMDFGGISGPITYTSKSHKANSYSKMYKADVNQEVFVPLTGWRKPMEKD